MISRILTNRSRTLIGRKYMLPSRQGKYLSAKEHSLQLIKLYSAYLAHGVTRGRSSQQNIFTRALSSQYCLSVPLNKTVMTYLLLVDSKVTHFNDISLPALPSKTGHWSYMPTLKLYALHWKLVQQSVPTRWHVTMMASSEMWLYISEIFILWKRTYNYWLLDRF